MTFYRIHTLTTYINTFSILNQSVLSEEDGLILTYLLNGPKIRPNNIIGIMIMLNKITTISILLINWFEIVRFFESMPYFSYQIMQNIRKFPRVSNIISETTYNTISPGWGIIVEFVSNRLKFMIVFKVQFSKVISLVKFIIAGIIFQLRTKLFETQEISSKLCQTVANSFCNLELVCFKKPQRICSSWPVTGLGNKGPLKVLNDTKLILDDHGNTLDWSGTISCLFLKETGSTA